MAALQLNKRHFNESNNKIVTQSGDAAFGHDGNDEFKFSGDQLSFWAGGKGSDSYNLKGFNGFVAIVENSSDFSGDLLSVSGDLFNIGSGNYADDLQVFSIDHRHLVISSEALDQKIVIADGMHNFGNIETVSMTDSTSSYVFSSSLVFDSLTSGSSFLGDFSASAAGASDIANALNDVIHEAQLTSQIENNLASEGLTWGEAEKFINESMDNPKAIYVGAQLTDLNAEMLGVIIGVSTDTVNEYFTANGFDPAGLG